MRHITRKYLAEFVYGATDGAVTTFAIISGVMGGGLSPTIVLILGISNVLADGFSMASSNYLSAKTEAAMHGDRKAPWKTAAATFVSFVAIGCVPLMPFIVGAIVPAFVFDSFMVSIICTGVAFIVIGLVRGTVTKRSRFKCSAETLLVGGIAAAIAYSVGMAIKSWTGIS